MNLEEVLRAAENVKVEIDDLFANPTGDMDLAYDVERCARFVLLALPVVEAAKGLQDAYKWTTGLQRSDERCGYGNRLADALAALEKETPDDTA